MKLTKGKLSKLFNTKKQSHKKKGKKKGNKRNTFRKNKRFNLANKTLKNFKGGLNESNSGEIEMTPINKDNIVPTIVQDESDIKEPLLNDDLALPVTTEETIAKNTDEPIENTEVVNNSNETVENIPNTVENTEVVNNSNETVENTLEKENIEEQIVPEKNKEEKDEFSFVSDF